MSGLIGNLTSSFGDYVETAASGPAGYRNFVDATQFGRMRQTRVRKVVACWKTNIKTVVQNQLERRPSNLSTVGGQNADGTEAPRIYWGADFELISLQPSYKSPSIANLTCIYAKKTPEAQETFPSDLSISCAAGVWSVVWKDTTFMEFNAGLGTCGAGLSFRKLDREKRRVDHHVQHSQGWYFTRQQWHWYNPLEILFDDVVFRTAYALSKTTPITGQVWTESSAAPADTIIETLYEGRSYAASLEWEVSSDGNTCSLVWCDQIVWQFTVT